jgi:hypothetical protein
MSLITLRNPATGEQMAILAVDYVVPTSEGDAFFGWVKIADGLPLEDLQADLWKSVKAMRADKKAAGTPIPGIGTVQTDDVSTQNITGLVTMAQIAASTQQPFSEPFTLADNTVVDLDAAQMVALGVAVGKYVSDVYAKARELREVIHASDVTPADLSALDITVGWPQTGEQETENAGNARANRNQPQRRNRAVKVRPDDKGQPSKRRR